MLFLRSSRPCVHVQRVTTRVVRQFSTQNYKPLTKIDSELMDAEEEEEEETPGEARLVELEHPYKDMRFFLLGVPFTDVQRVEEVCEDLKPDYILVSYDADRLQNIANLTLRSPAHVKTTKNYLKPSAMNFRANFDIMLSALMCGHHHMDPALEYCKKNDKPIYAVDRPEFVTKFRAAGETVGRLPSMLNAGRTVKMLSPFLFGSHKVSSLTQEYLEDIRESLDNEDVDFERQQLMKLPTFGEERGEIMAHRMFYFEGEPGKKVLGICQLSLFDYATKEWGKTTDEDMHTLHQGPSDPRKAKAQYVAAAFLTGIYTLPFYIASGYFDPAMIGIMWAAFPTYYGVMTPFKIKAAAQRTEDFYKRVHELDVENGLADRWRRTEKGETKIGPDLEIPAVDTEMKIRERFSPMINIQGQNIPNKDASTMEEEKTEEEGEKPFESKFVKVDAHPEPKKDRGRFPQEPTEW